MKILVINKFLYPKGGDGKRAGELRVGYPHLIYNILCFKGLPKASAKALKGLPKASAKAL